MLHVFTPSPSRLFASVPHISPAFNSSSSPPSNAVPMGKAGDHCISQLQLIE